MSVSHECIIPGCPQTEIKAKGLCSKHYKRGKTGAMATLPSELVRCRVETCNSKPRKMSFCEYHYQIHRSSLGPTKTKPFRGRACLVANCENVAGFTRGLCKWHVNWAGKYKFSVAQTIHILNSEHPCEICGVALTTKNLNVDHDHECCPGQQTCGECIRGLLCRACNRGIGSFSESVDNLNVAVGYLSERSISDFRGRKLREFK